jgi:hypothetical protein
MRWTAWEWAFPTPMGPLSFDPGILHITARHMGYMGGMDGMM